ncbi:hypothetical protein [Kitasatospora aburaviensis]|uniref:Uncharacterized protein n=1 Tax=Kitasatospora aburaviensis TaxID=67265 RepID=A0ABW1F466_9ACTN
MTDDMRSPEEDTAPGPTPVLRPEADAPAARTILSAAGQELARAIGAANKAVGFLKALGDREVSVNVITVMECMGSTQDEALQAAADAIRFSDGLVLHGVQWARIPGVEDRIISSGDQQWEYRVLLLVSAIDPDFGEADNPAHQADAGDCSTVLYLDAGVEEPLSPPLSALPRQALTPAAALQAAAETVRNRPELAVQGLLWARVPARWEGGWEYRLTVLASSGRSVDGTAGQPVYLDRAGR